MSDFDDIISAYPDPGTSRDTMIDPPDSGGDGGEDRPPPDRGSSGPAKTKYEIADEVARGGMGVILSARDTGIGRDVAMKVILSGWQESREFSERFIREAQVQGRLEHPNICPVHELGADDKDRPYFTMKMVHGYSLAKMIAEPRENPGPWDPKRLTEVLNIFLKICDGIAYAHSQGIIHRDLKPDNIMVGDFGEVYVMDWGLAKILGAEDGDYQNGLVIDEQGGPGDTMKTMTGSAIGTPAYMPPEQAKGLVGDMDERSDIYSLGALLYELLALTPPLQGEDSWEVLGKIPKQVPPPPSSHEAARGLSPELDSIILKCLEKEKRDRYRSVQDLKGEIELFLSGRPVGAMEYSLWQVFTKWVSRNRALALSTLAVLLVIVAAASVAYVNVSEAWKNEQFARLKAEENARTARTALTEAEARRRQAEVSNLKSRINMALMLEEKGEIGEAIRQYRSIKKTLIEKRLGLFPYIDLAIWKAQYNNGRSVMLKEDPGNEISPARMVLFSPDGQTLAIWRGDASIRLIDRFTDQLLKSLDAGPAPVSSMAFSPDKRLLAAGYADGDIILWDLPRGQEVARFREPGLLPGTGKTWPVRTLAFSPDGMLLASSGDTVIRVWDVRNKRVRTRLRSHLKEVLTVAFSPDGKHLVSGGNDRHVGYWDVNKGSLEEILYQHKDRVIQSAFTLDGSMIVTASADTTVRLWDLEKGREVASLRGHETDIKAMAVSPVGGVLMTGGRDGTVRFWDPERRVMTACFREHEEMVVSVSFSPDGREAVSADSRGMVRRWSLERESLVGIIDMTKDNYKISSLDFSPDGRLLAAGPQSMTFVPVLLVDPSTGSILHRLMSHGAQASSVSFSPDGKLLATGSGDGILRVADVKKLEQVAMVDVRKEDKTSGLPLLMTMAELFEKDADEIWKNIYRVAFSPDNRHLATACEDGSVKLWDTSSWNRAHVFSESGGEMVCLDFSPDGRLLAAGGGHPELRIWEVESRNSSAVLTGHEGKVNSVTFSPDGRLLAAAGNDRRIRLWDVRTWTCTAVMQGHLASVTTLAFSPDGSLLVSGGSGGTIKFWDVAGGECLLTLKEHGNDVRAVAFSPDGTILASGSRDFTIKLWRFGSALKPLDSVSKSKFAAHTAGAKE